MLHRIKPDTTSHGKPNGPYRRWRISDDASLYLAPGGIWWVTLYATAPEGYTMGMAVIDVSRGTAAIVLREIAKARKGAAA